MLDADQLSAPPAAVVAAWPFPAGSPWTLQQLSRTYAEWVLAQNGGDKQRAADIMGIDLSTLYRWRRKEP
jgi:two-component system response regulator HydG